MSVIPFILAAGSLPALIFGAPVPSIPSRDVAGAASIQSFSKRESSSAYTVFGGDGDVSVGWPSMDDWVSSFDEMLSANQEVLSSSCSQWDVSNNSPDEIDDIGTAIQSVANSTGVDARFILAIVMQESNGCVRVPTTDNGVVNPGLMQSHDGSGTCNDNNVQDPCPSSEITQMITDGTAGTSSGDGLQQLITSTGVDDVTKYYMAARLYNSGSIASDGNLGQGGATHCYVSDVANRLLGWSTGTSGCDANTIGDITAGTGTLTAAATSTAASATTSAVASVTSVASITSVTSAPQTTTTFVSIASATSAATSATPSVPAATTASSTSVTATPTSTSSDPVYPGATSSCTKYYSVVSGDYCLRVEAEVGITASQLIEWNSGLDESCDNLWLGYQYCIQA